MDRVSTAGLRYVERMRAFDKRTMRGGGLRHALIAARENRTTIAGSEITPPLPTAAACSEWLGFSHCGRRFMPSLWIAGILRSAAAGFSSSKYQILPPLPLSLWLSPNSARPACHLQHVVPQRFEMYRSGDGRTIQARHKNGAFLRPLELYLPGLRSAARSARSAGRMSGLLVALARCSSWYANPRQALAAVVSSASDKSSGLARNMPLVVTP
jgi:hypothetical protein